MAQVIQGFLAFLQNREVGSRMSRTYLVTGASGFIGAHLVRRIVADGDRVKLLTRQPHLPAHLADLNNDAVEKVQGDLLEPASFRAHLRDIDGVYHLAGFISTAASDARKVWDLNYQVTRNLLDELQQCPVPRMVYLASIFALAGGDITPANEDTPYNLAASPVTYFHAKRQAELAMRAAARDMEIVFTYPTFCYGPGDALVSSSRLLLMHLRRQLPTFFSGGFNSLDVRDAAATLVASMHQGKAGQRYIVGGVNQSYQAFFRLAAQVTGIREPRIGIPDRVLPALGVVGQTLAPSLGLDSQAVWMAQRHWYYDDSRARRELGHHARSQEQMLRDATLWFIEHGFCRPPPNFR